MEEITVKALDLLIDETIKENSNQVKESLFANTDEFMQRDTLYAVMMTNCLSVSVKVTTQIILEILKDAGVLRIDEREAAKILLKRLSSDLKEWNLQPSAETE